MKRAKLIVTAALLLIACVLGATSWHDQCEAQTITGSFTVSEPTPTPTPLPTRTPRPINGSVEEPGPNPLTINIIGKTTGWLQNKEGMALENIATSSYKSIATIILAPNATPLDYIFTGVVDSFTKAPPSELPNESHFVDIYEFTPEGTQFSIPVNIQLYYEETDIPGGIDETTLKVFQLNPDTGDWTFIPSVANLDANTVTFSTTHFSIYALIASPILTSMSTPPASPTPHPSNTASYDCWIWVVLILVTEFFILNIMLPIRLRSQKRFSRKHN